MATKAMTVTGGVDTHKHTHYAAAVDDWGRLPGHQQFQATGRSYQAPVLAWMRGHGQFGAIACEKSEMTRTGAGPIRSLQDRTSPSPH